MEDEGVSLASEQQTVEYINRCYHTEDDTREQLPTVLQHITHIPVSPVYV